MTKPFASNGAWPVADAGRRMTRREIEEMERDCPSAFYATLEAAAAFVSRADGYQRTADNATHPEVKAHFTALAAAHRSGDQVGAFRLMQDFGRELDAAFKHSMETDE